MQTYTVAKRLNRWSAEQTCFAIITRMLCSVQLLMAFSYFTLLCWKTFRCQTIVYIRIVRILRLKVYTTYVCHISMCLSESNKEISLLIHRNNIKQQLVLVCLQFDIWTQRLFGCHQLGINIFYWYNWHI
jgi:hypothetical protein